MASDDSASDHSSEDSALAGRDTVFGFAAAHAATDPLQGRSLDGVTILRLIAEGGMGRVYEGRQEKPRRDVAVKVMRPGLATPAHLRRFDAEAQVLARLQHPRIAHVYAVGTHEIGGAQVPYFVMELIRDAKTLTEFAHDHDLSTRQRLDLFRQVCEAVAHGHQKGVIHRDLKPGNILVDQGGQPKVIDFGVARSTDADLAATSLRTGVGQLVGTLQYMSPEQFDGVPDDVDVRADVYALGVVFYELLTGQPPYDVGRKPVYEAMRIVREQTPTPMSAVNRTLRGDVAVIAGKCLEKDRDLRYATASELAADVARLLAGEPIAASPPGFWRTLLRLGHRHRAAAAATVAAAAAFLVALVGISFFAIRERAARQRADAAATVATQRLYAANLFRLDRMIGDGLGPPVLELFAETERLAGTSEPPLELRCLRAGMDDAIEVLTGHEDRVTAVRASPDGRRLASVAFDGTLRLWDAGDGRLLATGRGHAPGPLQCIYSPDGASLATASQDDTARIWDATDGTTRFVLPHPADVGCAAFSPDGSRVATGGGDADRTVRLWDAVRGDCLATFGGDDHGRGVACVAFDASGTSLATGSLDGLARIFDLSTRRPRTTCTGHTNWVSGCGFTPDGTRLVTASFDGTCRIWDAVRGDELLALRGHTGPLQAVAVAPDGCGLATASDDRTARLWDRSPAEIDRARPLPASGQGQVDGEVDGEAAERRSDP